jgi:hypothetical protein
LKCLHPERGIKVLEEIHMGVCGMHIGARALAAKVVRQGYFWPTLQKDADTVVRTCDSCQRNADISHLPATEMVSITGPWPFAQWGMNIVGPLPQAAQGKKFVIIAIDYFTKWVEAEPLSTITDKECWKFF